MTDDPRRREALRTALGVFERYGYRKTSMEDVAREVGLSRQGLYLWYPSKKALFAAVIEDWLRRLREEVAAALEATPGPSGLVEALDALHGRFLEGDSTHREELLAAAKPVIGDRWPELVGWVAAQFAERLPAPSTERALLLLAASRGTKQEYPSRQAYRDRMALAVELLARP